MMTLFLFLILSLLTWSLGDIGVAEIGRGNHFSGAFVLALALIVALTAGLIINVNFLPVAQ